MHVES